jgi:hypothetical protein
MLGNSRGPTTGEVWLADPGRRMQDVFLAGVDATGCETSY